jgi:glutamate-ammonia-ligase adenylyltransferase
VLFRSCSPHAKKAAQNVIDKVLAQPRDLEKLRADVDKMRRDMDIHKPPKGELDFKLLPGGLVDSEFVIHMLQLSQVARSVPQLGHAIALLTEAGALPDSYNPADAFLSRFLFILRLVAPDCHLPSEPTQKLIAQILKHDDWLSLMDAVAKARGIILDAWNKYLPQRDSQ